MEVLGIGPKTFPVYCAQVSVMKCGLLSLSPEAMMVGEVSYFEFSESLFDEQEYSKMAQALGSVNKVIQNLVQSM